MGNKQQRFDIDEDLIVKTIRDSGRAIATICDMLGYPKSTVRGRKWLMKRIMQARAERLVSIATVQTTRALEGDKTMLIWLGKNELGQTDRLDTNIHSDTSKAPCNVFVTFPEDRRGPREVAADEKKRLASDKLAKRQHTSSNPAQSDETSADASDASSA